MFRTLSLVHRFSGSIFPKFSPISSNISKYNQIRIISTSQIESQVPQPFRQQFTKSKTISIPIPQHPMYSKTIYTDKSILKIGYITKDTYITFSKTCQKQPSFIGLAAYIFAQGHKFMRKSKEENGANLYYDENIQDLEYVLELAQSRIRSREMADSRGDQATTQYFDKETKRIAEVYNLKRTVIKGKELLSAGFRLMHAVGRASEHQPTFVNLKYEGNTESDEWYSFVGKGVCFDSGGLNLKPSTAISGMHIDKHGATSVLSAFETIVRLKLKVNLTVSMGFVQNSISKNAYRPLDIIKSRKGLTVQIGNTDAQGRLVLADCMNWTQQTYKVKQMIQLSTLTGAVVIALGKKHAGMFGNNQEMMKRFRQSGNRIGEEVWQLPLDQYHHDIIKGKQADISNAPRKPQASSSQAAAFLQNFVQDGVKWIHLDIAGVSDNQTGATGYGAILLVDYIKASC